MLIKSRLGLTGVILITLCLSACDSSQETNAEKAVVRPVKLITVDAASATRVSQFPAVVRASRLTELSMPTGGTLQEFPVKEGQRLKRGDLIAKLDQRDFQSSLESAKAQFQNAEQEYQRAVRLAEQDAIARNVLEQRKAQYDVSKSQLDQAEKALADSVLRAPFKGVVAQSLVNKLQTLSPGQEVVKYMSDEVLEATIDLPAHYIANIPKEESNGSLHQDFIILDVAPNQLIEAKFKEASLLADTPSQTSELTLSFQPPEDVLVLPGMNAIVELRVDNKQQAIRVAIPLDAISSDGQKHYIWIVDKKTMTVSKRAVSIEQGVGETMVVTDGLAINDTIAGAGAAYLSEGMKIKEWQ
jgi:RND family efflux transporter MFP subunit